MRAELGNKRGGNDLRRALVRNMKWRRSAGEPPSRTSEWLGHIFIYSVPRRRWPTSANTMTLRTSFGRSSERIPGAESAAQPGWPVACIAARHVSMPSPTISRSVGSAKRTAPPRQGPSIIFAGSIGAFPAPSAARNVLWIYQRDHCRPPAARWMLQPAMEAQHWRRFRET
jgi:hypothetical protein